MQLEKESVGGKENKSNNKKGANFTPCFVTSDFSPGIILGKLSKSENKQVGKREQEI